jgi:uncharacterized membrane protein YhhN
MQAPPYVIAEYVLLVAWTALLGLGFAAGKLDQRGVQRIPRLNKLLSSGILLLCSLLHWRFGASGTPLSGFAALILAGMSLSLIGDVLMAGVVPLPQHVFFGMGAFGAAHAFYISGYLRLGTVLGLQNRLARVSALGGLILLAVPLWWALVRSPRQPRAVNCASLAYALLLSVMVGLAVSLALQNVRFVPLALGALLFLVSDLLLGHRLFQGGHFRLIGDLVWMTYIAGQLLIVRSTVAALDCL